MGVWAAAARCRIYLRAVLLRSPDGHPPCFWCFVRDQKKSQCPPAFHCGDNLLNNPPDICQAFNQFFTSVHSPPAPLLHSPPLCSFPIPELPPVSVSLGWLQKSLLNLTSHKAPGCDGISPTLLRSTACTIASPLLRVMNSSLSTGTLPTDWKLSQISPVYNAGK